MAPSDCRFSTWRILIGALSRFFVWLLPALTATATCIQKRLVNPAERGLSTPARHLKPPPIAMSMYSAPPSRRRRGFLRNAIFMRSKMEGGVFFMCDTPHEAGSHCRCNMQRAGPLSHCCFRCGPHRVATVAFIQEGGGRPVSISEED